MPPMLRRLASVAALAVSLATLGCPAHADSTATYAPEVSGHRGTRVGAPENTIPAMEYAHRAGADYVEFDVRWTKDGVMVTCTTPAWSGARTARGWCRV